MTIPAGFAEVTLEFTGPPVPTGAAMTFGVRNTPDLSASAIASAVSGNVTSASLLSRLSSALVLSNIHVKRGPDASGTFADLGTALVGGSAGDSNPATAALVNKITSLGGRKNRGRWFVPGVIEADTATGGVLTGTALTAFQTIMTNFLAAQAADGIEMVILHSNDNVTPPTTVDALTVQSLLGRQGRRLRRS